ncbi:hypothetical protein D3C84_1248700 [compost metagenome]
MMKLGSLNMGNGRLMRKLFKTSVGYMAERAASDMKTMLAADIELAMDEIARSEHMAADAQTAKRRIGFIS